jgi:thiol-disulfide isomerase/thioredoxin
MKETYAKYRGGGLAIVGIDVREDPDEVREFTQSNGYDWTFVVDQDGTVTNRYLTSGIPTHLLVDAGGVIQAVHVGELQESAMEELLQRILDTASASR